MATIAEEEVLEPTTEEAPIEEVVADEEVVSQEVENGAEEESTDPEPVEEEEGIEITLNDESLTSEEEEEEKIPWVRQVRKDYREAKKQNRELQKRLEELEAAKEQKPTTLGPKPKLEDFDYDTERFEAATDEYYVQKAQVQQQEAQKQAVQQEQEAQYQRQIQSYETAKTELGVSDFQEAEEAVMGLFDLEQQNVFLRATENPALAVYAVGKNLQRAGTLSQIKDPVKLAAELGKLESQLKVTKRKAKPSPETTVKGSSPNVNGKDSTLARLEAEALKTNDYTKVFAYEKKLKAQKLQQS